MTREEIEELMEELTRQFAATRDPEIREELYELARELATMEEVTSKNRPSLKRRVSPKKVPMLLRDHPLMRYHGLPNWPPAWTWIGGVENKQPQGEVGILKTIELSKVQPANRFFLRIEYEKSSYMGCLLFDDRVFCSQMANLLEGYCNRPIAEIGSLDLAYTF
jgi:hypothetical protein